MSSPTITYLRLDEDYDPIFEPGSTLTDANAVAQAILTSLRLFQGEWWENLNLGLPVFQSILGVMGSKRAQGAINLAIIERIKQVPYVVAVTNVESSFVNGQFSFVAQVQTSFGPVQVTYNPGSSASLEA